MVHKEMRATLNKAKVFLLNLYEFKLYSEFLQEGAT